MIFSEADHIEQIIGKTKTETRRSSSRYRIGRFYGIQPKRTSKAIPDGKILIIGKVKETRDSQISERSAKAEGGYTPEEYERLYERMHPSWQVRTAYYFAYLNMATVNILLGKGEV